MRFPEYTEKTSNCQNVGIIPFGTTVSGLPVPLLGLFCPRAAGHFPRTPDDLAQSLPICLLFRGPGLAPLEKLFCKVSRTSQRSQRHDRHAVPPDPLPSHLGDPAQNLSLPPPCRPAASARRKSLRPVGNIFRQKRKQLVTLSLGKPYLLLLDLPVQNPDGENE